MKFKYKVGDRVKIKTIYGRKEEVKSYLRKNNYILTIYGINAKRGSYEMDGWMGDWSEYMIEGLYEEPIYDPIQSRFEILDL